MDQNINEGVIAQTFQKHHGLILAVARRYAPTPDLVYDIVQQVFVDFAESAIKGNWDSSRDPAPFLYQITKNRATLHARLRKRESGDYMEVVGQRLMEILKQRKESVEEMNGQIEALEKCMEKLPEKSRQLIKSYYSEEISKETISLREQITLGTLRKAIFRIRIQLRNCIRRKTIS